MKIVSGTRIAYTSAAGVRVARVKEITIAPAADGIPQTWLILEIDGYRGTITIPADRASLVMFKVEVLPNSIVSVPESDSD